MEPAAYARSAMANSNDALLATLFYTLARIGLFLAVMALAALLGVEDIWLLLLVGVFGSAIISVIALRPLRDRMAVALQRRRDTVSARLAFEEEPSAEGSSDDPDS